MVGIIVVVDRLEKILGELHAHRVGTQDTITLDEKRFILIGPAILDAIITRARPYDIVQIHMHGGMIRRGLCRDRIGRRDGGLTV